MIDLASGKEQVLTTPLDRNCQSLKYRHRPGLGRAAGLLFSVEDHGNVHLYLVHADGSGAPELVVGGDRWITEWDWAPGTLAFVAATPVCTGELIARDLDPAARPRAGRRSGR